MHFIERCKCCKILNFDFVLFSILTNTFVLKVLTVNILYVYFNLVDFLLPRYLKNFNKSYVKNHLYCSNKL